ncbi:MAG: transporter substrate-binding protein [Oculatellaceae cyanobacterium Prado106]|jgi:urea ABC transporter urea binding protein|nr:transporter substrate-binding protein [Oculatellaceae cyanobacterium Prado106]
MRYEASVWVGILHSLSGDLAVGEAPLRDAELMAIAEINEAGGILGHLIQPIVEDGYSDPQTFQRKAYKLLQQDQISALFGCWTSLCRKLVLPLVEEFNTLLWYPLQYEGLECSKNIFYTGLCSNQQLEPALQWLLQQQRKRIYLLGMDYVFPRISNKIAKAKLQQWGGTVVGEAYPLLGSQDFQNIIAEIQQLQPDAVLSTINGDSNLHFYPQYAAAGITAEEIPVMAVSVAENLLEHLGAAAAGHYATWGYFQSLDTPASQQFVKNFRHWYGESRVVSDPMMTAYAQVHLWKQAVEAAGSFDTDAVRQAAYGQTFASPAGLLQIEPNHHLSRNWYIGKMLGSGQFQVLAASDQPVPPLPWLGIDHLQFENAELAVDLLGEVSQSLSYISQLSQKTSELQEALSSLTETNLQLSQALNALQTTQMQLIQTEKMSSLGQMVAGIAHEINNPASFIQGNLHHVGTYVENLLAIIQLYQQADITLPSAIQKQIEERELDYMVSDLPRLMSSMQVGATRIRDIVQSLKSFSRLDESEMKAVDLHDGLDSTLLILDHQLQANGDRPPITLIKDYGNLPLVECYASQINQVFLNLLSNAIDAFQELPELPTSADPPRITIRTQPQENPQTGDRTVLIQIMDNGCGIPPAVQQRLFDPFFTTKPVGKGTGLGLSISYQIITEQHHGTLSCSSSPEQGTMFSIEIPIHPISG